MERDTMDGLPTNPTLHSPDVASISHFSHLHDRHWNTSPCPNRINITVTALWVATPLLSTFSVAAVCVAVTTNQWLITQENIKNGNYTGKGDQEYFPKHTVSGLWTLCYTNPGKDGVFCSNIEYFPKEEYSPDLKDSTMAIPYTVTKSATFFILSTLLVFAGELCCLCGHFSRQRRLLTFISGVIFIISGLLMLIGLVMYISIFKAEVGGKLRPTSQLQPAVFTYKYGYSFILYVSGFVSTEISGTCAVFLYIYWHQKDWRKKGYESRSKLGSPTIVYDIDPINRFHSFCKKHPSYMSSTSHGCSVSDGIIKTYTPSLQRRLYLNRTQEGFGDELDEYYSPFCLKHSLSCSIVNELYSEGVARKQSRMVGTTDLCDGYPSLSNDYFCHRHRLMSAPYSSEFLGRNCMTQYLPPPPPPRSAWEKAEPEDLDECSSTATHDHDFVPFDLDETAPVPSISKDLDDVLRGEEIMYKALSKTTPV